MKVRILNTVIFTRCQPIVKGLFREKILVKSERKLHW